MLETEGGSVSSNLVQGLVLIGAPAQVVCVCGKSFLIGVGTPVGNEIRDAEVKGIKHYERFCDSCGQTVLSVDFPRRPIKRAEDEKKVRP